MERELIYKYENPAGEERIVEIATNGGMAELVERSSGPDTEMVFGDRIHARVLRLGEAAQAALLEALGGDDLPSALRRLFAVEEGAWLSDVQDLLDQAGKPYGYASYGPGSLAYRPPFFA